MSETATQKLLQIDRQRIVDRRTAQMILHMVDRFIPEACRRDASHTIMEFLVKNGLELTDRRMRLEYEAWKTTQLDPVPLIFSELPS